MLTEEVNEKLVIHVETDDNSSLKNKHETKNPKSTNNEQEEKFINDPILKIRGCRKGRPSPTVGNKSDGLV